MPKLSPVAATAQGPMVISAVEQYVPARQRLLDDALAIKMLPRAQRAFVSCCRFGPIRHALQSASERSVPGSWGGLIGRKRYADDQVAAALSDGIDQLVVLGAGLDTLACRLGLPAGIGTYEIDLAENIAAKRAALEAIYGRVPERLRQVPIDFDHDDLITTLRAVGWDSARPTMFVWEAVTQYLTEAGVRATLQGLESAAAGSRLIFTYVLRDLVEGKDLHGAERLHQQFVVKNPIWKFGLDPDQVGPLLSEHGWTKIEDVGPKEYAERYFGPAGRELSAMEIERFVLARRP
ncbi:SAM-dependent methyltransferase [Microlunatus elymi]|uniref:S-adenosyl-L-methionine-dependent methyltransferase n=1 Tax=Microlunatus elymi TaxID=2596828 RepID=A0A516PY51_9ACTN|nr:SAM-dependent methyltransferase [Microlunatus elymi]QDP96096.1 SAM-dependent methyltransferase [Microlunatus elymi]